jgi:Fe-S-cluster-containing dehydrogenase component/formate-dependent nitrite reductase membrane component NrfD
VAVNYGFVIDNRSCIGCHACSTACKSENEVPLGVYRTWVKYTETGTFPDTQRHFQVTRCNHCANPPCARICPTGAMYQRDDGIVEFNKDACIGCKACLQACPYDAIHIDPESGTAAKCHYCSHKIEVGLEPSCAVVCPTHAIIAGDMDDPESEISRVLSREKVSVRKPEQGTAPKVFYIDGSAVNLVPTATDRTPETFVWSDVLDPHGHGLAHAAAAAAPAPRAAPVKNPEGVMLRAPQPQGEPSHGPIHYGERQAAHMVQVGYNAQHKVPWHWPVPAYLVTKGIGAGVFLLLAIAFGLDLASFDPLTAVVGGALSVAGMLATTALLVYDLEKPERFLYILLRPQWRSWLARGSIFLMGFSTIGGLWWALETAAWMGLAPASLAEAARPWLLWSGVPLAIGAAIYTAWLFAQAEGRDLWQSPLLPPHLLVQALMMGAATLAVVNAVMPLPPRLPSLIYWTLAGTLAFDLFLILLGEFGVAHPSEVAAKAAHAITHGAYRNHFWLGAIVVGHLVPLGLLAIGLPVTAALAGVCTVAGLYAYEYAFVMAPQEVPNS